MPQRMEGNATGLKSSCADLGYIRSRMFITRGAAHTSVFIDLVQKSVSAEQLFVKTHDAASEIKSKSKTDPTLTPNLASVRAPARTVRSSKRPKSA